MLFRASRARRDRSHDLLGIAAAAATLIVVFLVVTDLLARGPGAPTETIEPAKPSAGISEADWVDSGIASLTTLGTADLPAGFKIVEAGPARFTGGSITATDSWDVVFEGDAINAEFVAAESIVGIYATSRAAAAAVLAEQASEGVRGGRKLLSDAVGQDGEVWEEPLSETSGYRLTRAVFRVGRAMAEVTLAGPPGDQQLTRTLQLARLQVARLAPMRHSDSAHYPLLR